MTFWRPRRSTRSTCGRRRTWSRSDVSPRRRLHEGYTPDRLAERDRRGEQRAGHRKRRGAAGRNVDRHRARSAVERDEDERSVGADEKVACGREPLRDDPASAPCLGPDLETIRNKNDDLIGARLPACEPDPLARRRSEFAMVVV